MSGAAMKLALSAATMLCLVAIALPADAADVPERCPTGTGFVVDALGGCLGKCDLGYGVGYYDPSNGSGDCVGFCPGEEGPGIGTYANGAGVYYNQYGGDCVDPEPCEENGLPGVQAKGTGLFGIPAAAGCLSPADLGFGSGNDTDPMDLITCDDGEIGFGSPFVGGGSCHDLDWYASTGDCGSDSISVVVLGVTRYCVILLLGGPGCTGTDPVQVTLRIKDGSGNTVACRSI